MKKYLLAAGCAVLCTGMIMYIKAITVAGQSEVGEIGSLTKDKRYQIMKSRGLNDAQIETFEQDRQKVSDKMIPLRDECMAFMKKHPTAYGPIAGRCRFVINPGVGTRRVGVIGVHKRPVVHGKRVRR